MREGDKGRREMSGKAWPGRRIGRLSGQAGASCMLGWWGGYRDSGMCQSSADVAGLEGGRGAHPACFQLRDRLC